MRYQLTITGEAADQALLQKTVDVFAAALRAVATAEIALEFPPESKLGPTKRGPVDFAVEPVAIVIDLTDDGAIVSASVRDGAIEATGTTVDDAMAAVAAKALGVQPDSVQPAVDVIAQKEPPP